MALFERDMTYEEEGRALVSGDFQNMLMNAKMTVTLTGNTYQTNPITDALIIGSANYCYFGTHTAAQTVSIVFDCARRRKFKSIMFSVGYINQVQASDPWNVRIYGSNDNTNWTLLDEVTGAAGASPAEIYRDLSAGDEIYRYLKFYSHNEPPVASSSTSGVTFFVMQANI